ncbi:MAG: hypothetical protein ACI97N_000088 [Cognaticolwellia sp.]|jgi:hypothetical protein
MNNKVFTFGKNLFLMNKPTKYKSQITQQFNQLTIDIEPKFVKLLRPFTISSAIYISVVSVFFAFFLTQSIVITLLSLIFILFILLIRAFPSNIRITPKSIENYYKKHRLNQTEYVDFYISVKKNRAKIRFGIFNFSLRHPQDISKLTTGISELLGLEFYSQYQLSNKVEILTYHFKNQKNPVYQSNLRSFKRNGKVVIEEKKSSFVLNPFNWFEISKIKPLSIDYCFRINDERKPVIVNIDIKNIEKIIIMVNQKSGLFLNQNRIKVKVIEIKPIIPTFIRIADSLLYQLTNSEGIHRIFKTRRRGRRHELTNWRDAKKLYKFFKKNPALQHIEIEKEIIS